MVQLPRKISRCIICFLLVYLALGGLYVLGVLDWMLPQASPSPSMVVETAYIAQTLPGSDGVQDTDSLEQCRNYTRRQSAIIGGLQGLVDDLKGKLDNRSATEEPFLVHLHSKDLPASSVYCHGTNRTTRTCRISNLYYNPRLLQYFVVQGNTSIYHNAPRADENGFLEMVTLEDHNVFFWDYVQVPEHTIRNVEVRLAPKKTFIMMRFIQGNMMHTLHDDFLGLYYQMRMYGERAASTSLDYDGFVPFSKDHNILIVDGGGEEDNSQVFKLLTAHPVRYRGDLDGDSIVCFADAVVGQSKQANWYQYGFGKPQGPIPNKTVSGSYVREGARYIMREMGLAPWDRHLSKMGLDAMKRVVDRQPRGEGETAEDLVITILSRRKDRLLVNEEELARRLERLFGFKVVFVRNEDQSFREQIQIVRRSILAIGMHGSLLIMGMFLPPGAMLVELYPYAVPGENYTPYKTMCENPGMELTYARWVNANASLNIPHPEYDTGHGGLGGFSEEKRRSILETLTVPPHECCTDPHWLFRIYQDTVGDLDEIIRVVFETVSRSHASYKVNVERQWRDYDVVPARILTPVECTRLDAHQPEALLRWEKPWNYPAVEKYEVWVHQTYQGHMTETPELVLRGDYLRDEFSVWIRSYYYRRGKLVHNDWSLETKIRLEGFLDTS